MCHRCTLTCHRDSLTSPAAVQGSVEPEVLGSVLTAVAVAEEGGSEGSQPVVEAVEVVPAAEAAHSEQPAPPRQQLALDSAARVHGRVKSGAARRQTEAMLEAGRAAGLDLLVSSDAPRPLWGWDRLRGVLERQRLERAQSTASEQGQQPQQGQPGRSSAGGERAAMLRAVAEVTLSPARTLGLAAKVISNAPQLFVTHGFFCVLLFVARVQRVAQMAWLVWVASLLSPRPTPLDR